MKKTVCIIRDDMYHPKELIDPQMEKVFDREVWNVVLSNRLRDAIDSSDSIDLLVMLTVGRPDGEGDITFDEQEQVISRVKDGMGILFVHAGLVLIEEDSPFYKTLNSGRFIGHSHNHVPVENVPIRNVTNPILEGVEPFTVMDEHYYCQVNIARTDMLMLSTSEAVTAAGGWAHSFGKGKVVGLTPGHTEEALGNPQMIQLLKNASNWATIN
ncbi:ThuA domain-containing protein [Paenibacillus sp. MMO-58]|uniref:ThuA domain-containing protein n=1 Tax=Paenibacillus sp. MMO-58 TaxID=3081290 RepID=UPI003019208F